ncbi:MAG: hypothetical protein ACREH8_09610 [Opitutaceae bacterium]
MNPVTQRPESLREIAEHADSIEAWSLALGDLLDEIGFRLGRGVPIGPCLQEPPPVLREKFVQGELADAFGAALAEHLAGERALQPAPAWTTERERFLATPWFADDSPKLRDYLRTATPAAFRAHGVFIDAISLSRA